MTQQEITQVLEDLSRKYASLLGELGDARQQEDLPQELRLMDQLHDYDKAIAINSYLKRQKERYAPNQKNPNPTRAQNGPNPTRAQNGPEAIEQTQTELSRLQQDYDAFVRRTTTSH